ncbi:MAG: hypothetical protein K0R53_2735 [Burkholderiales bacterium]|nr:hypothetical protein [Burkholderiales bacterium]
MLFEQRFERFRRHIEHDRRIHLHETPVRVVDEARVAREPGEPLRDIVVQPDVEHGVHHPRHRKLRAGPARHEQWVLGIAESLASRFFERSDGAQHLLPHTLRKFFTAGQETFARVRRHDESGRHREFELGHFTQVGALAAEERAHPVPRACGAFGELDLIERVNILRACRSQGRPGTRHFLFFSLCYRGFHSSAYMLIAHALAQNAPSRYANSQIREETDSEMVPESYSA